MVGEVGRGGEKTGETSATSCDEYGGSSSGSVGVVDASLVALVCRYGQRQREGRRLGEEENQPRFGFSPRHRYTAPGCVAVSRMASVSQLRPPSSSSLRSTPLLARSHGNQSTSISNAAIPRQTDGTHGITKTHTDVSAPARSVGSSGGIPADRASAPLRRSNLPTGTTSRLAPAAQGMKRPQRLTAPKAGLTIPQEASSLHSQSAVLSPSLDCAPILVRK